MEPVKTVLLLLITLGILVTIHEWGHFWVARRCGVKVLRFSVGFGTALYKWTDRLGTEFVIAAIPLGGYVKMLDEREEAVPAEEVAYAFNRKSVKARLAIVLAGPLINILFAVILYWGLFLNGVTEVAPVVGKVTSGSLAEQSGLRAGYEIVAVDGKATTSWDAVNLQLVKRIGDTGQILLTVKPVGEATNQTVAISVGQWLSEESITDTLEELGIRPWHSVIAPVIGSLATGEPADQAGLKVGDKIIAAEGKVTEDWLAAVEVIRAHPSQKIQLRIDRAGQLFDVEVVPLAKASPENKEKTIGYIGVGPEPIPADRLRQVDYGPIGALVAALGKTRDMTVVTLKSLVKMVQGKLSIKNLSGPITIAKVASDSAKVGLLAFISFLAFLSLSLGIINLLPIPVLDGGHVVFYTIEGVIGRPLPEKVQTAGVYVGMAIVMGLSVVAIYNDLLRL